MPKRDGPYIILQRLTPTTYEIAATDDPTKPIGVYHTEALRPVTGVSFHDRIPMMPIRKRGRPPNRKDSGLDAGTTSNPEGESVTPHRLKRVKGNQAKKKKKTNK